MTEPTLIEMAATYAKRRNARKTKHALACARRGSLAMFAIGDVVYGPQANGLYKKSDQILTEMTKMLRPVMKKLQGAQRAAKGTAFEGKLQKMIDSVQGMIDTVNSRIIDIPEEGDRGPTSGLVDRLHKFLDREEKRKAQVADLTSKALALVSQISSAKPVKSGRTGSKSQFSAASNLNKALDDMWEAKSYLQNLLFSWEKGAHKYDIVEHWRIYSDLLRELGKLNQQLNGAINAYDRDVAPTGDNEAATKQLQSLRGLQAAMATLRKNAMKAAADTKAAIDAKRGRTSKVSPQINPVGRHARNGRKARFAADPIGELKSLLKQAASMIKADGLVAASLPTNEMGNWAAAVRNGTMSESTAASAAMMLRSAISAARASTSPAKVAAPKKPAQTTGQPKPQGAISRAVDRLRTAASVITTKTVDPTSPAYKDALTQAKDQARQAVADYKAAVASHNTALGRLDKYVNDAAKSMAGASSVKDVQHFLANVRAATRTRAVAARSMPTPFKRQFAQNPLREMYKRNEKLLLDAYNSSGFTRELLYQWIKAAKNSPKRKTKQILDLRKRLEQLDKQLGVLTDKHDQLEGANEAANDLAEAKQINEQLKALMNGLATKRKEALAATSAMKAALEAKSALPEDKYGDRPDPTGRHSRPGAKSTHAALPPQTLEAERKPGGGSHSEAVSRKIATLMNEGKPQDQAVAIALDLERRGEL